MSTLEKWVPTETLVIYAPAIVLVQGDSDTQDPALWLLILMLVVSPLFVVLGAFASDGQMPARRDWLSAALSAIAFLIWSTAIPGNGWQVWDLVADNSGAVAVVGAIIAALFGLMAEGISKRYLA